MDYARIQRAARDLQVEIWRSRDLLTQSRQLTPIEILQPDYAAFVLGLDYQEVPSLGEPRFGSKGKQFRAAGLISFADERILVSSEFAETVMRFTAGHELGHWMLHHGRVETMHRDLPIDGSVVPKTLIEREANYFSACFLMPERLLQEYFNAQFGVKGQFIFNEASSFQLSPGDPDSLHYASSESLDRELALARCTRFNGRYMNSLAQQFGVSDSAMARRIKELKLIRWP
ncbi:MAG: ImmA/IrrE family metallo-endopeptidase [Pseudomonadota bacterium]